MPFSSHQLLVFSDLDGCLPDHFSYSYQAARPALNKLKASAIPLIITASKTLAEIAELSAELELVSRFIVENGAGGIMPANYFSTPDVGQFLHNGYLFKSSGAEHVGIVKKTACYQSCRMLYAIDLNGLKL